MNETKKGFIQLHLSVMLAGFTGLFGRLITLNEVDIVWYRMLFTSCILLVFTGLPRVGWRKFLQLCGCGALSENRRDWAIHLKVSLRRQKALHLYHLIREYKLFEWWD